MKTAEMLPARIIDDAGVTSLRPISEGAEKWLYRPLKCLDNGFVYLVDYMGNDKAIAQAAGVSYGKGTKKMSEEETLIRYLMRQRHTSPFEMVEFKFHCKMPIFVARQWIRHRTANVNEYSGRYSEMSDHFYMPDMEQLRIQSGMNKQGRGEKLTVDQQARVLEMFSNLYQMSWDDYQSFLSMDLARELARIGLSVANYTEWYWKMDLHNLLHFLRLRLDSHAQYEIRVYAEAIAHIVKDAIPVAYRAFEQYSLRSLQLMESEIIFIHTHAPMLASPMLEEELIEKYSVLVPNKREVGEFVEKMRRLGFVK
jgi:thymidylate synthase (FAD)